MKQEKKTSPKFLLVAALIGAGAVGVIFKNGFAKNAVALPAAPAPAAAAASPTPRPSRTEIVVGVARAPWYADPQGQNSIGYLELGADVDVREVREAVVQVAAGRITGWVWR